MLGVTAATSRRDSSRAAGRQALADAVLAQLDQVITQATSAVMAIDGYRRPGTEILRRDVREHIEAHFHAALGAYREDRTVSRETIAPIGAHAMRRLAHEISVADFIHAFEACEGPLLQRSLEVAEVLGLQGEVARLVMSLRGYFYLATVEAAETYLEAERLRAASGEGARRDLLEDLLSAHAAPPPGPLLEAAREAGLDEHGGCLVIASVPTVRCDEHAVRGAAVALSRAVAGAMPPLTVVRREDIVIVLPAPREGVTALAQRLGVIRAGLAEQGVPLAVGMSMVHVGLAGVAGAYHEAVAAARRLLPSPGMIALATMGPLEYLIWSDRGTARRLIAPAVARFVADDAEQGGQRVLTLRAYFDADLNAKLAGERLCLHPNTVHYRLAKIAEATGCDLRSVRGALEVLVAAGLLAGDDAADSSGTAPGAGPVSRDPRPGDAS